MEYTKGEWKVREPEIQPQRLIVDCRWKEGEQNWHRSICRTFGYCDTKEEESANAHLIASAPDMYEALKWVQEDIDDHRGRCIHVSTQTVVRKALAKAEGKWG